MNHQTLADPPNLLGQACKDKVLKKAPVVAHTTRGMVIDANGKQVAVKLSTGSNGRQAATSLEGKANAARPTEPLDDGPKEPLNSTINLVGFPEVGKKVSTEMPILEFSSCTILLMVITCCQSHVRMCRLCGPCPRGQGGGGDLHRKPGGAGFLRKSLVRARWLTGVRWDTEETR